MPASQFWSRQPLQGARGTHLLAAALAAIAGLSGCGDGPICQQETELTITSPLTAIRADANAELDGLQVDVAVTSTVVGAVPFTLVVKDASDAVVATATALGNSNGDALFADVTVPRGTLTFVVTADAGSCGRDEKSVALEVIGTEACSLSLSPAPRENTHYAPRQVLRAEDDQDLIADDLQVGVTLDVVPRWQLELYAEDGSGSRETLLVADATSAQLGAVELDDDTSDGAVAATVTLRDGARTLGVGCRPSPEAAQEFAAEWPLWVDGVAPECTLLAPLDGDSVIPQDDKDNNLGNDIQFDVALAVSGDDVEGQTATLSVSPPAASGLTPVTLQGPLDEQGQFSGEATFADTGSALWQVTGQAADYAGNTCEASSAMRVVYDGCGISATASPSNTDAVPGTAGAQLLVDVSVDAACIGRTVTSDCGTNDPSFVAAANNQVAVTVCTGNSCEIAQTCQFSLTSSDGITTTASVQLAFDNVAPAVALQLLTPAVPCGATITANDDVNAGLPGVQALVRVVAASTTNRSLLVTTPGGGETLIDANVPAGELTLTLEQGTSTLQAQAIDGFGNTGLSSACTLSLADIAVNFSTPVADGVVSLADGTLNGNTLEVDVCGTVSETGTSVTFALDGGAPVAAQVTGTTWCVADVGLTAGNHTLEAVATLGPRIGTATLALLADLSPPDAPTNITATPLTRQSVNLAWTAPADTTDATGYEVKVSNQPITEGNFDGLPTAASLAGAGAPGTTHEVVLTQLRPGATVYLAVAMLDAAGNRSTLALTTTTLSLSSDGAFSLANPVGNAGLGQSMVVGNFNGDAFDDLAVGAPFEDNGLGRVYIYYGGATGLAATPDVTLSGTEPGAQFGNALTAVAWSGSGHDLAVGAPLSTGLAGRIYVFSGTLSQSALDSQADLTFEGSGGWFASGAIGFTLTALRFDSDGLDDLAIGAPGVNGFGGGVAIVHGGALTANFVALDDTNLAGLAGAAVTIYTNPAPGLDFFAAYLHNLGPTQGATDTTDDLLLGFSDDVASTTTTNHRATVLRGAGKPAAGTVAVRSFTIGQDVVLELASTDTTTDFGAGATTIDDSNGDGARDIVISAFREGTDTGAVYVVDGNTVGNAQGIASLGAAPVRIARIAAAGNHVRFGIAVGDTTESGGLRAADLDDDGLQDLVIATGHTTGPGARLLVWYGGALPQGLVDTSTAALELSTTDELTLPYPSIGGRAGALLWPDINGDGLDDLALSSHPDHGLDGAFEVLGDW